MEDKKYPIALEVLTPLSTGAGNDNEWTKGLDFVQKDRKVYVLDIQKAVAEGVDISRLTDLFLRYDEKGICQLLGNKLELVSRLVFDAPVSTNNSIKTFMRTQLYDKPVIPGSSIKGSVRSALFNYLRDNERSNDEVFGTMKDGTDLMRFIRISDVEMPSTLLINTKLFNLQGQGQNWQGGWKQGMNQTTSNYNPIGFNTLYECVAPGKIGIGSITLAGNVYELVEHSKAYMAHSDKKRLLLEYPISHLFGVINEVTRGYLKKEKTFFEKYPAERTEELVDCIDYLLSQIPDDGSCCLLKMSAGVGFHSITGDWQYEDYDQTRFWTEGFHRGKKKYKSRKTAECQGRLLLMGFVKIRLMDNNEVEERNIHLREEHQERLDSILIPLKHREAEIQQRLAEADRRKEAVRAELQKQEHYSQLMESAKKAYISEQWSEAMKSAEETLSLCPDKQEAKDLIDSITKAKAVAEYRQQEQAAAARTFSQPLSEVIKGKTSAGNLIGTMAKWLKVEGHKFGDEEYDAFLQEAKTLATKEQKNIKNKRKDLIKAIGEEKVQRILADLGL